MKKLCLNLIAVLFLAITVNAQETNSSESKDQKIFKPQAGDFSVEANFTPFGNNPISMPSFKGRYFIQNDLAIRGRLNFDLYSTSSQPNEGVDDNGKSYIVFGLAGGVEKHFGDVKRLSPYIGADIGFETKGSAEIYRDNSGSSQIETTYLGAWQDMSERSYLMVGANVVTGVDIYIVRKLFIGLEVGFGVHYITYNEVTKEVTNMEDEVLDHKFNELYMGFNYNSAIRLGFWF